MVLQHVMMFSMLHIKQLNFMMQMNLFQHLNSHLKSLIKKLFLSGANNNNFTEL